MVFSLYSATEGFFIDLLIFDVKRHKESFLSFRGDPRGKEGIILNTSRTTFITTKTKKIAFFPSLEKKLIKTRR